MLYQNQSKTKTFHLLSFTRYCKRWENIASYKKRFEDKTKQKLKRLQKKEKLLEQRGKVGKEFFLQKIGSTSGIQVANSI